MSEPGRAQVRAGDDHDFVAAEVASIADELIELRRDLHAHPEPSWEEVRTTRVVNEVLARAGLDPRPAPTATGAVCDIGRDGPLVVVRADLDALRMHDAKDVSYRSTVAGACHACGHDVHTAVGVGGAIALHRLLADGRPGRVRVLFQPAEETVPGGALPLTEAGLVDGARAVFALHCDPRLEVGHVGVSPGPITSAADQVIIRLGGPGGHTGRPQSSVDLVHVVARVAIELPMGLDRRTDPRDGVNLTFGAIAAGDAANVIPSEAVLRGSLRALGRDGWEAAAKLLPVLLAGAAEPLGATWELEHRTGAPPVVNDPWCVGRMEAAARRVVGADHVGPTSQSTGGEDFSWYLERAPGGFARLGTAPPGAAAVDIHTPTFDVDERAIAIGARLIAGSALEALAHP